jgi:hypothetical protein
VAGKQDDEVRTRSAEGGSDGTLNLEDQLSEQRTSEDPQLAAEELEDEARPHSEDLDSEGIPDLDDELRAKEITGDPQEGMVPPRDYQQGADDIYARDTLDQRLAEEEPDRLTLPEDSPRLMDPESGDIEDRNEFEPETGDEAGALSAEESAIHEIKRPTEHGLV